MSSGASLPPFSSFPSSLPLPSPYFRRFKTQLVSLDETISSLKETQRLAKERMAAALSEGGTVDEKKLIESEVRFTFSEIFENSKLSHFSHFSFS
jgi:hypothetical protein